MRIFLIAILIVGLVIGIILFLNRERFADFGASVRIGTNQVVLIGTSDTENLTPSNSPLTSSTAFTSKPHPENNATTNTSELATSNQQPATASPLPPATILDNCRVLIHNYAARFGENPVGNNAEITAALRGSNPKQVDFFREDSGLRMNEQGELVDAYGTPLFFHQVSAQVTEIRSAGEDKILWTLDDQVTR